MNRFRSLFKQQAPLVEYYCGQQIANKDMAQVCSFTLVAKDMRANGKMITQMATAEFMMRRDGFRLWANLKIIGLTVCIGYIRTMIIITRRGSSLKISPQVYISSITYQMTHLWRRMIMAMLTVVDVWCEISI